MWFAYLQFYFFMSSFMLLNWEVGWLIDRLSLQLLVYWQELLLIFFPGWLNEVSTYRQSGWLCTRWGEIAQSLNFKYLYKSYCKSNELLWAFKVYHGGKKSTFFTQKSGTSEPFAWCGWALWMKCWLLNRLSPRPSLDFWKWQVSCWGCLEGTWTWISRYFSPKMIQDFLFLMLFR